MNGEAVADAGTVVAADAEIVAGTAAVDESAFTGESAPVIREALPGRRALLAGSRILHGRVWIRPLTPAVLPRPRRPRVPRWWPVAAMAAASAVFLVLRRWDAVPAEAVLVPPYLTLLAFGAARALERAFWRRLRLVPLAAGALGRAAACNTLVVPSAAIREDGALVAIEFWPVRGVSPHELAGAARQGSMGAEGGPERSVVVLAKHRGRPQATTARDPLCGPVGEIAAEVARRGGAWPAEAQALQAEIRARGGGCLGVADGGRPLGLVELRPSAERSSLEDVGRSGVALSFVNDPALVGRAVRELHRRGCRVAVAMEAGMPEQPPPGARFVLAGTGWAASRPSALDLDADPSKLPDVLLGARRVRRQAMALVALAAVGDASRIAVALSPAAWFWALGPLVLALAVVAPTLARGQVTAHGGHALRS